MEEPRVWVILAGNPSQHPFRCSDKTSRNINYIAGQPSQQCNIYFYEENEA